MPGSGLATSASRGRTQIFTAPRESVAWKARLRPSGEMRGQVMDRAAGGGASVKRVTGTGGVSWVSVLVTPQAAARPSTATSAQARRSRWRRRVATGTGTPAREPPSATHCSCSFTSWAVWMRSFGSLARQAVTTRTSAGGVSGAAVPSAGGSACMIAPIRLAWLLPAKARVPVTIS